MANERAKALRKTMSDAEWKLWHALRSNKINGYRFRRQHPIGVFIPDFVCLEKKLVVEVDGEQHSEPGQISHDAERTDWLRSQGYCVIRFWTNEVMQTLESVVNTIARELDVLPVARDRPPPPRRATIT